LECLGLIPNSAWKRKQTENNTDPANEQPEVSNGGPTTVGERQALPTDPPPGVGTKVKKKVKQHGNRQEAESEGRGGEGKKRKKQ